MSLSLVALTPKQARFVAEYLKDLNAGQAAIRAGYSAHTAETNGPRMLRNAQVGKAVAESLRRRNERVEVKADDVLRELLRIATTDIGEAFDEEGRLKPIRDMSPDCRRAISGLEVEALYEWEDRQKTQVGTTTKIKFWDKTRGLELLGKHLKLFTDKLEHSGTTSICVMNPYAEKPDKEK